MCHEQFHRARAWDRPDVDEWREDDEETEPERADEDVPAFLTDDDPDETPDEDLEILTDGGD